MLWVSQRAGRRIACSQSSTSSEGITVTASGTAHTKGSWAATPLWTSTPFDACGIYLAVYGMGGSSANARALLDVGVGASGSEVVLIPNLMVGGSGTWVGAMNQGAHFFFPIYIASASRLNCRLQGVIASDTCTVVAHLFEEPIGPGKFVGQRVTGYGPDTATSSGVAHTPGSTSAYSGTATQIVASTTNPIRYMQIGIDLGTTDTTSTSTRGMVRIGVGSTPNYVAEHLPWGDSTTLESQSNFQANWLLSHMGFNIPAGTELRINAMLNGTGEGRGWGIYGVD